MTFGKTYMKVRGVTFKNANGTDRQILLYHLAKHPENYYLTFRRDQTNEQDPNAVKVIAHRKDNTSHFQIGYAPKDKAYWISRHLEKGLILKISSFKTAGIKNRLGCTLTVCYQIEENKTHRPAVMTVQQTM